MDFTNYKEEIQTLVNRVMECRSREDAGFMQNCQKLIEIGTEAEDDFLLGFAYYHLAEGCFCQNDHQNFVTYLSQSIVYQQKASQWKMLTRSYNMLGINAATRGNTTVALDQYITALSYGRKYEFPYEMAIVNTNIGYLYLSFGEYRSAEHYLKLAGETFSQYRDNSFGRKNLAAVYIILGRCSLKENNLETAVKYEKKARELGELEENELEYFMMQVLCARIRDAQGNEQERDVCIDHILRRLDTSQIFLEGCDDIFDLLDFLLEIEKYQELERIFPKLERIVEKMKVTHQKMELLRRQVKYYKAVGKQGRYLESCAKLYEYGEILREENVSMIRRSTELRFSLEEAREKEEKLLKEKEILRERSEKDPLTGLPNRYKLNKYAEEIFDQAYAKQESLSIEIFDVDYFKQYNDTYGHQAGDKCLKKIGKILQELMEADKNIFCARYGGDEFVIIYYGKTDEEILALAEGLKKSVLKLKLVHEASQAAEFVTISQGIHNSVPIHQNRMWDYLYSADGALYEVKRKKKNSICLIHRVSSEIKESVIL